MSCPLQQRETAEVLLDYASRRAAPELAEAFERHMESCPACREFARDQHAVWGALDAWEAMPVSSDFDARLLRRIEEEEQRTVWAQLWAAFTAPFSVFAWRPALPVAAACVTILAVFLVRGPVAGPPVPARTETVDIEQVERTLDDINMLRELGVVEHAAPAGSHHL
jgi:hypothetical protein